MQSDIAAASAGRDDLDRRIKVLVKSARFKDLDALFGDMTEHARSFPQPLALRIAINFWECNHLRAARKWLLMLAPEAWMTPSTLLAVIDAARLMGNGSVALEFSAELVDREPNCDADLLRQAATMLCAMAMVRRLPRGRHGVWQEHLRMLESAGKLWKVALPRLSPKEQEMALCEVSRLNSLQRCGCRVNAPVARWTTHGLGDK